MITNDPEVGLIVTQLPDGVLDMSEGGVRRADKGSDKGNFVRAICFLNTA